LVIQNSSNNFTVEPSLAFNHSQHEVKSSFPVERDVSN
jgi:hypothetical protein